MLLRGEGCFAAVSSGVAVRGGEGAAGSDSPGQETERHKTQLATGLFLPTVHSSGLRFLWTGKVLL